MRSFLLPSKCESLKVHFHCKHRYKFTSHNCTLLAAGKACSSFHDKRACAGRPAAALQGRINERDQRECNCNGVLLDNPKKGLGINVSLVEKTTAGNPRALEFKKSLVT